MLCRTVPYRTVPHRTVPADWHTCNRDRWCWVLLPLATATTLAPKPGEGVSDYKEGSSRPESARGKLLHTFGNFTRLPNFALNLHCAQQPQSDKERTLFFFPLRNLVLDTTPHTTQSNSRTSAAPLRPQPSIDWGLHPLLDHVHLNPGACSITLICATGVVLNTTLTTTSITFTAATATTAVSQAVCLARLSAHATVAKQQLPLESPLWETQKITDS